MRIMRRGMGLGALIAAGLILSNGVLRANDQPVVHVKAVVKDGAVRLQAEANAPFEYTTYRPSESLYVLDLSGVSHGRSGRSAHRRLRSREELSPGAVHCRRKAGGSSRDSPQPRR